MLDPLNGPCHGRRYPLDASLDGVLEHCDVALPARCPLEGLACETLLSAGEHEIEGGEGADAGSAEAEDFTSGGGGNADGHGGCWGVFETGRRVLVLSVDGLWMGNRLEGGKTGF
jgi:hypothetical protein